MADSQNRILVTFDKDFGELAFRAGLPASSGIILFRVRATGPGRVARVAVAAFQAPREWAGHFSVVEEDRIRMTRLVEDPRRA